jgi:hypothetical protein
MRRIYFHGKAGRPNSGITGELDYRKHKHQPHFLSKAWLGVGLAQLWFWNWWCGMVMVRAAVVRGVAAQCWECMEFLWKGGYLRWCSTL